MQTGSFFLEPGKWYVVLVLSLFLVGNSSLTMAQGDTLTPEKRTKFNQFLNNFDLIVYVDAYYNALINKPSGDTANVVPFASNCPFVNEFRLNVASVWFYYSAKNFRGKFELQFGDAPNLLSVPENQFIKNMKQAAFGFRIYKTLWVDLGYQYNPIGYESSYPIRNQLSTVTVGGYYETGNFLGIKLSSQLSPSIFLGAYLGNPYTLAYGRNKKLFGGLFFQYSLKNILTINYNNMLGMSSLATEFINHQYIYNNLYFTVNPVKNLMIVGQGDFGWESKSAKPPDTTKAASGFSGFLQLTYQFTKWFSATVRGQYFNDPDGAVSQLYAYDGKLKGLMTYGGTAGIEFIPVKNSYIRAEYTYLAADKGNNVFSSGLSDNQQTLIFTAGVKFGFFK